MQGQECRLRWVCWAGASTLAGVLHECPGRALKGNEAAAEGWTNVPLEPYGALLGSGHSVSRAQPLVVVGLEAVVRELPPAGLGACLDYLLFPLLLALNSLVAARQVGGETWMSIVAPRCERVCKMVLRGKGSAHNQQHYALWMAHTGGMVWRVRLPARHTAAPPCQCCLPLF